jgi:hypothetical protein
MPKPHPQLRFGSLRGESGQSLIEFAFAVPFLLLIVLALVDFGRALNYWLDATHVANEGARLAVVNGSQRDCATLASFIQGETYGELKNGNAAPSGVQAPAKVIISFPPPNPPHPSNPLPQIGDPIKVTVTASYKWVPSGKIPGSFPIAGSATMRLEQLPGFTTGCTT